jgi:hypothetical protein
MLGCYNPSIQKAGYLCGEGGACPDGFHCAGDGRCYQGDAGSFDVPPDAPVCLSQFTAQQACTTPPAGSDMCNPACQNGCKGCGWCAIEGGLATCEAGVAATKDVGEVCNPDAVSVCKPGLYCQPECGNTTGRCYRICDQADEATLCPTGSSCNVIARTKASTLSYRLCSFVDPGCNPVALTGCQTGYYCYPAGGNATECDCPGTMSTGATGCALTRQCVPGDSCVGITNTSTNTTVDTCLPTCVSQSDCTSGTCLNPAMMTTMYGYCM